MPTRLLHSLVLLAWAGFLLWLLLFSQPMLARLLHPKLWWLVGCGAVILILFLAVTWTQANIKPDAPLRWQWPKVVILLVPILYGLVMLPSARFDSQTFMRRMVVDVNGASLRDGDYPAAMVNPEDREPEAGALPLTRINAEMVQLAGREVETVCQVLRNDQLPEDLFICYRFLVTCCAADAQPVFVLARQNGHSVPENDAWVRIRGPISLQENRGITLPLLTIHSIIPEREPAFPFLF